MQEMEAKVETWAVENNKVVIGAITKALSGSEYRCSEGIPRFSVVHN